MRNGMTCWRVRCWSFDRFCAVFSVVYIIHIIPCICACFTSGATRFICTSSMYQSASPSLDG